MVCTFEDDACSFEADHSLAESWQLISGEDGYPDNTLNLGEYMVESCKWQLHKTAIHKQQQR